MKKTSNQQYINVRGKEMYVEIHGDENDYPLLYLHGGPGESCYEFCYHQAERLQDEFKFIAIDQRGVCRSEEIRENEPFSIDDIIYDCEELREILEIDQWAILGHSFGGYLALKYATKFPKSITKVVFECPTFDIKLSGRSLFKKMAKVSKEEKMEELAEKCFMLADSDLSPKELMLKFIELRPKLGEKGLKIHLYNFKHQTDYSLYTEEQWQKFLNRTSVHNSRLIEGEEMYESILPLLEQLKQPSLLIRGQYDPVTCEEQVAKFQETVPYSNRITFQNSGHFPHTEAPDEFAKTIVDFLKI